MLDALTNPQILAQLTVVGLMMGAMYALLAIGITFIASIMKLINWAMGEFYMIGSYVQYYLIVLAFGPSRWYLALPIAMLTVFVFGLVVQRGLLAPMFKYDEARRFEYATIVTIALSVLLQNLAIILAGPYQWSPQEYLPTRPFAGLSLNGSRLAAVIGPAVILGGFYVFIRHTMVGLSFLGAAQNRLGPRASTIR